MTGSGCLQSVPEEKRDDVAAQDREQLWLRPLLLSTTVLILKTGAGIQLVVLEQIWVNIKGDGGGKHTCVLGHLCIHTALPKGFIIFTVHLFQESFISAILLPLPPFNLHSASN